MFLCFPISIIPTVYSCTKFTFLTQSYEEVNLDMDNSLTRLAIMYKTDIDGCKPAHSDYK